MRSFVKIKSLQKFPNLQYIKDGHSLITCVFNIDHPFFAADSLFAKMTKYGIQLEKSINMYEKSEICHDLLTFFLYKNMIKS